MQVFFRWRPVAVDAYYVVSVTSKRSSPAPNTDRTSVPHNDLPAPRREIVGSELEASRDHGDPRATTHAGRSRPDIQGGSEDGDPVGIGRPYRIHPHAWR